MSLLITPPVGLSSPRKEIEAWIARLEEMRRKHAGDADAERLVDTSLDEARMWLELQE